MAGEWKSDKVKKFAKRLGLRLTKGYEVKPIKKRKGGKKK